MVCGDAFHLQGHMGEGTGVMEVGSFRGCTGEAASTMEVVVSEDVR